MSKICPQCNEPNPDRLNFCGYCGAKLDLDGELDEYAKLHNELAESRELLRVYKQQKELLEKANEDLLLAYNTIKKESEKNVASETLNNQITKQEQQIEILTQKLTIEKKRKKKTGLFCFLGLLSIGLICFLIHQNTVTIRMLEMENMSLKQEIEQLQANNSPRVIKYKAINKTYFHDFKNDSFIPSSAYLVAGDVISIQMQIGAFGYTDFINSSKQKTSGWIKMTDLKKY